MGVKKTGPTVKELQEEYGGAGVFYIPTEEHYMLDKEEWRYDKFPEFYNGSNVLDFYDPDIEKKLAALEKEEEEILAMEEQENELMQGEESANSDGLTFADLKQSLKEVRSKKAIKQLQHKMKSKLKARPKRVGVEEMIEHFESTGIEVNKESLRSRSKARRTIADLEGAADKNAEKALNDSDDESDIVDNEEMAEEELKARGRKRKRTQSVGSDDYMESDDEQPSGVKTRRSMTPAQRKISA